MISFKEFSLQENPVVLEVPLKSIYKDAINLVNYLPTLQCQFQHCSSGLWYQESVIRDLLDLAIFQEERAVDVHGSRTIGTNT